MCSGIYIYICRIKRYIYIYLYLQMHLYIYYTYTTWTVYIYTVYMHGKQTAKNTWKPLEKDLKFRLTETFPQAPDATWGHKVNWGDFLERWAIGRCMGFSGAFRISCMVMENSHAFMFLHTAPLQFVKLSGLQSLTKVDLVRCRL